MSDCFCSAVRQRKVRQEKTMARTGILPGACYPEKLRRCVTK